MIKETRITRASYTPNRCTKGAFLQVRSSKNVFVESETKLDISVISNLRRVTSLRTVGEKRDPKIRGHVGTEDPIKKRQRRKI
jgi:hypothetical protein